MRAHATAVALTLLVTHSAFAVTTESERGLIGASVAPVRYVAPSPDDAGAAALLYNIADLAALPPNTSINTISFEKTAGGGVDGTAFTMSLKNTTATTLTSPSTLTAELVGAVEHVNVIKNIPDAAGWVDFPLATPFVYTGGGIEIVITWDSASGARSGKDIFWRSHTTGSSTRYLEAYGPDPISSLPDDTIVSPASSSKPRPNIRFDRTATASPWLVVHAGTTLLADNVDYTQPAAFRNGVSYPVTLELYNAGGSDVTLGDFVFGNLMAVTTTPVVQPTATLAPGVNLLVEFTHAATADNTLASYDVAIGDFNFGNQGNTFSGAPAPEIDVWLRDPSGNASPIADDGQIYLGGVAVGAKVYYTGVIANIGTATLNLSGAITVTGGTGVTVSDVVQPSAASVNHGRDLTYGFALTPTVAQTLSTATIAFTNDDATEASFSTQLRMKAVTVATPPAGSPEIDMTRPGGAPIADGATFNEAVDPNENPILLTYNVLNTGTAALTLSPAVIFNEAGCTANVVTNVPSSIPAGGSGILSISVTRSGDDDGAFSVSIDNNDGNENPYDFTVGIPSRLSPNIGVTYGGPADITAGKAISADFLIANTGLADLAVTDISVENLVNAAVNILSPRNLSIAPAGSETISTSIAAGVPGTYSFDLVVTSNDPDAPAFRLTVAGTAADGGKTDAPDDGGCAATGGEPLLVMLAFGSLLRYSSRRRGLSSAG